MFNSLWLILDKRIRQARIAKIFRDPMVTLGQHVKIHHDAKVESRLGGRINIGDQTEIWDGVLILGYGGNVQIGSHCNINPYTIIYGVGETFIGNNVLIAGHTMIIPTNHRYENPLVPIREQGIISKGIRIEDDVWIGHGCTILDGVTIGEGSVVAAGSVVSKSVPPFTVVGGVPASYLKNRKNA